MDGVLEFLNKWVARPIAVLGAFITIYILITSAAQGQLSIALEHFGLPSIPANLPELQIPTASLEGLAAWIIGHAWAAWIAVISLAALQIALGRTLWFALAKRPIASTVLTISYFLGAVWLTYSLFHTLFPEANLGWRLTYEAQNNEGFGPNLESNFLWVCVAVVFAILISLLAISFDPEQAETRHIWLFGGASILGCGLIFIAAVGPDGLRRPTSFDVANCTPFYLDQISANERELAALIFTQRGAMPIQGLESLNKGKKDFWGTPVPYPSPKTFTYAQCFFWKSGDLTKIRSMIGYAVQRDSEVVCELASATGTYDSEGFKYDDYRHLTTVRGATCGQARYPEGGLAVAARADLTRLHFERDHSSLLPNMKRADEVEPIVP